jgi:hypothetical protein
MTPLEVSVLVTAGSVLEDAQWTWPEFIDDLDGIHPEFLDGVCTLAGKLLGKDETHVYELILQARLT